ncbi:hypothetical protein ACEWY4_014440 [Coilia grayii]|uniref:Fibronectin type-III domain-containing protein n=1 Tax=Coilia grayii TaxID=363190 RepID=A0ABD1JSB9_9TELE
MCYATTIQPFFFLLCAAGICKAQSRCTAIPSRGQFVQVGANFTVFCIIQGDCRGKTATIFQNTTEKLPHVQVNATIIKHEVQEIRSNTTYTCTCGQYVICGVDVSVGYPPEVPQKLACEQHGAFGHVNCTCETGKNTGLWTTSEFRVRTASDNSTDVPVAYSGKNWAVFYPGSQTEFSISIWAVNRLERSRTAEINVTLSHIVRPTPPSLANVTCSSRLCHFLFTNVSCCHMLEVQHRADSGDQWSAHLFNRTDSNHNWSIKISLEPFVLYHFRGRLKSTPHMGLWSHWSAISQHKTEEEAPLKLDVWYIEESPSSYILLWKKLNQSEARGNITGYTVLVENTKTKERESTSVQDDTNFTTHLCPECFISISAVNSKGQSPPANLSILHKYELPPQSLSQGARNDGSIALSWQKSATAAAEAVTGYLVEWLLAEGNYKELQWQRLDRDQLSIHITGLQPHECYKGAVYTLFEDGRGKAEFDMSYQPKAPERGPDLIHIRSLVNEDSTVLVAWIPIQRQQWRGCLRKYTIYIQRPNGEKVHDVEDITSTELRISALIPSQQYTVFMTAWTDAGESAPGKLRFFTLKPREEQSPLVFGILVTSFSVVSFLVVAMCLCQVSSLRRRCLTCCHLLPDMVPDPANSKWAKECSGKKGEVSLHLYLSDWSVSEEEEPDTLEVREMSSESLVAPDSPVALSRSSSASLKQDECITYTLSSPPGAYLKSFSQESDQTQGSRNTEVTVDYISTHEMLGGESDREGEGEEEEDYMDRTPFLPCPLFDPQLRIGGKLTLNSVKIDCSSLLDEPFILHC